MKRGYLLPEGCKDLIDVWKKPKQPWQDPIPTFTPFDLWMLKEEPMLFKFKPTKPIWMTWD